MENVLSSTNERILAGAGLLTIALGSLFVWFFNPITTHIFPPCPLLTVTGFACPGCGLTRAFHALFHGDIITALDFNALVPLYVIAFVFVVVSLLLTLLKGRSLPYKLLTPTTLAIYLIVSIGFGVLRNIPVYPLSVLYP